MINKSASSTVRDHLERHYGFTEEMTKRLRTATEQCAKIDINKLNSIVDSCFLNRENPPLDRESLHKNLTVDTLINNITSAPPPEYRYVLYTLIKKVLPLRLDAIAESASKDWRIDIEKLGAKLQEKEGAPESVVKDLHESFGTNPTVDIVAQKLVGLIIDVSGRNKLCREGYNCCFWGWSCSWGCLIVCCSI